MYSDDLYTLNVENIEEYSSIDLSNQLKLTNHHRKIFQEFLAGQRSSEDVSDLISDYGLNPEDYWDIVDANISRAIAQNTAIEDAQWLLQKLARLEQGYD